MFNPRVWCGLAVLAGCDSTVRNPAFCGDGFCSDESLPFCDKDGIVAGQPDTCIAPSCEPGSFVKCRGSETLVCNSEGDNIDILQCTAGCVQGSATCAPCTPGEFSCGAKVVQQCGTDGVFHPSESCDIECVNAPKPHCAFLEPKYLPDVCDVAATTDFTFANTGTFDTSLDMNCSGGVVPQNAGPGICVVRARSISLPASVDLAVIGTRALALVADESVEIAGFLDAGAKGEIDGAGGSIGNASSGGSSTTTGSGGGGFATAGGAGGTTAATGGAANGGAISQDPALLMSLIGGSRGGGLGNGTGGGGAGGAITLVSCRGTASVSGTITVGGGGGTTRMIQFDTGIGRGGGSGGNVVIQGMNVSITGQLFANGGGGSSGIGTNSLRTPGADGLLGTTGGIGGGGTSGGGDGGAGGSLTAPAAPGKAPTGAAKPGGGGGSVGFLQTYTPDSVNPTLTPSMASPALQPNLHVKTR